MQNQSGPLPGRTSTSSMPGVRYSPAKMSRNFRDSVAPLYRSLQIVPDKAKFAGPAQIDSLLPSNKHSCEFFSSETFLVVPAGPLLKTVCTESCASETSI